MSAIEGGQATGRDGAAPQPRRLRDALRQARIEAAERADVVVDLRDAEVARLEILNEALEPVFADIPRDVELFDRGISRGDKPRLWIDIVAHVAMARDKRTYRFVQDTSNGRIVLAESLDAAKVAEAVTDYIARRLVERERAMATTMATVTVTAPASMRKPSPPHRSGVLSFVFGVLVGAALLFGFALFSALRSF
jgi:hypothetical protein